MGLQINLQELRFQGNTVFSAAQLNALVQFIKGAPVNLLQLRAMAQIITAHYQSAGYVAAQAYLPPQNISDGIVLIAIAEGHYGKIVVQNQTQISSGVIAGLMDQLAAGDLVRTYTLDSQLQTLGKLPGTQLKSRLVPGPLPGTSDLLINIAPTQRLMGALDADNAGNDYTGAYRIGGTLYLNEPLGQGDIASLRLLNSLSGLNYVNANYQMLAGHATFGGEFSSLSYALGKEFKSLAASGNVVAAKLYGSYPILNSVDRNLTVKLIFESKNFRDYVATVGSIADKSSQLITGAISADNRDAFGSGGSSAASLSWSLGNLQYQSLAQWSLDSQTANMNGQFSKLAFALQRTQYVSPGFSLYGAVSGQIASKNLDPSEKMELGGMFGVRAYPEGEAYGDNAMLATVQAQWQFANYFPHTQFLTFYDAGTVEINASPWLADTNTRHLQAAGIGVRWDNGGEYSIRIDAAHKFGSESAQSAKDADNRVWVQAVRYFQ